MKVCRIIIEKMGGERDIWGQDPKIFQVFLLKDSLGDSFFFGSLLQFNIKEGMIREKGGKLKS